MSPPTNDRGALMRELKRGTLEMVLLALIAEREMYGYEIVATLEERSEGGLEMKEGTLYPLLYRLEEAAHIEPHWRAQERGVPRKYYRITASGQRELKKLMSEWRQLQKSIDRILDAGNPQ